MTTPASRRKGQFSWLITLCSIPISSAIAAPDFESLFELDLQTLGDMRVTSVSNTDEALRDAPATTIVITREHLLARGYRNLSQIFDDLPGMDVVRPYGDVYYANYWRGIRNNLGSPFLFMLDGITQNDLYYNSAETLVTLPISAVDRIEVVYGPASVVYGANAFAGVVNVITRHGATDVGVHSRGEVKAGSFDTQIADVYASASNTTGFASVAARYDIGRVDTRYTDEYEWTQDRYYSDPALWGGFAHHSDYGQFDSPHRNTAIDLRVGSGNTTLAAQQQILNSGYGTEYPGDRVQNHATWREKNEFLYLSHQQRLSRTLTGKTLLAYRTSGLDKPSDFLEAFNVVRADGSVERQLAYSLWNIQNESTQFQQDVSWAFSDQWHFNGGLKAEWKHLQKASRIHYGPAVTPENASPFTYAYPTWPLRDTVNDNTENTKDLSFYALTTWRIPLAFFDVDSHLLNAGFRVDDNSVFGSETSLRGGWVSHYGDYTVKLMAVGDSYQTPTPRVMYSGWAGSGSSPDLAPETARTTELSVEYARPSFMWLISAYQMESKNAIINFPAGAANAGEARITGADVHFKQRFALPSGDWLRFWSYYSFLDVEETLKSAVIEPYSPFADTSEHKLHLGAEWPLFDRWSLSMRSRYFSERDTIATNPIRRVKAYTTVDGSVSYRVSEAENLQMALTVENLFDKRYFHPGVRQADAGLAPGAFDAEGVWQGSAGYFNSLLPQEGRGVFFSLRWDQ